MLCVVFSLIVYPNTLTLFQSPVEDERNEDSDVVLSSDPVDADLLCEASGDDYWFMPHRSQHHHPNTAPAPEEIAVSSVLPSDSRE